MMLQWTGRERIRNGWINDVSLSLSLSTHSWTQKKRCKKLLHSWLHRVWVSLTGVQWWMSISCSLIRSLEFTKVFVYCPDTWDRNLLPSLSTHTLTSSTFTLSQLSIPVWKIPSTLHWRPVLCLCFVNFIPKTCYMGPWEFMKLYISDVNTRKQNPQIQTGNINTLGFLCPSADWRKGGGSLIIITPRGGVTPHRH